MGSKVYLLFGVVVVCFALFYFIFRMLKGRDKAIDNVTDPAKLFEMADELYEQGKFKKAVKYYHKAADQGHVAAQFNLGLMHVNGQGVPQDDKAAVKYFKLAAEQGLAKAQIALGLMYREGRGVPQDDKEAFKYLKLAAEQGDADAQFNLGIMYGKGHGVPQDDKAAVKYFTLAAEQGDQSAINALEQLKAQINTSKDL
jgi:uncharacterized protein